MNLFPGLDLAVNIVNQPIGKNREQKLFWNTFLAQIEAEPCEGVPGFSCPSKRLGHGFLERIYSLLGEPDQVFQIYMNLLNVSRMKPFF